MKIIKSLLFNALLVFLFGCNAKDKGYIDVPGPIIPQVNLEYVDREGNPLLQESDLKNLYEKGVHLDVLSVTDDRGVSIEYGFDFNSVWHTRILEQFYINSPKMEKHYIIKYRVPQLLGESVEELKLIFKVDGFDSKFTKAWYNEKEILCFVTIDSICPEWRNPQYNVQENIEEFERRKKELLYNGDTVAYIEGDNIFLVLPVEESK